MGQIASISLQILGSLIFLVFVAFAISSAFENKHRAVIVALISAILGGSIFWGFSLFTDPLPQIAFWLTLIALIVVGILFYLPIGELEAVNEIPIKRFDEREIMFARMRLEPGTTSYTSYYEMHPDHEIEDEKTRSKPGLLSLESKFANPYQFASIEGSFFLTESLRSAVDGPVLDRKAKINPQETTQYIKGLANFFGAKDVGITVLQPYHVYSHIGRGSGNYGDKLDVEHAYAIAFTVEMNAQMVASSPYPPTTMETGKQYVEAARVAVQLAGAIRAMGFPARAHIDGNYRVIAPLVARDAGLGEIGRMTLLMTPREGPRVRLGVVTTDLDLIPDVREPDQSMIDFCTICEKCAAVCPTNSIPFGPRQEIDGAVRWKLNPDSCFRYWNVVGTDCARCVSVCPFSHPDAWSHNLIRSGIKKSGSFRRFALWMDHLFYGKKPRPMPVPDWVEITEDHL